MDNKIRQADEQIRKHDANDRSTEQTSHEIARGDSGQRGSADAGDASGMNEKSSGIGRRDKGTGLATKDGVTGSDYDGQVAE